MKYPRLTDREARAFALREHQRATFREIGADLGVSPGRARQVYVTCVGKLRVRSQQDERTQICNWVAEDVQAPDLNGEAVV